MSGRCRSCGAETSAPAHGGKTPTWCNESCRRRFRRALARVDSDIEWREGLIAEAERHHDPAFTAASVAFNSARIADLEAERARLLAEGMS